MGWRRIIAPAMALALAAVSLIAASPEAPLANAAEERDLKGVEALIEKGADPNAPQVDGMTALHWAAYRDDLDTVKLLLRAGADVKARNRYGVDALSLACVNGNASMVGLLLEAGADPNATLPGGETPLMTAARTGKIDAVKALLSRGADVHAKESGRGQTALMWAAAEGHADVVELLIEFGADFRERLDSGFTAFFFAAREGRIEVVRALLKAGVDVNEPLRPRKARRTGPKPGISPLLLAATNAHYELAAMLLDAGADPNAALPGFTVLHQIASVRKPGVGDNDPPPDGSGSMDSIEFVKKMAASGADLNARMTQRVNLTNTRLNTMGATPFLIAAQTADAELMRTLAKLGADPDITNADNSTALMIAAGLATRSPGEDAGTEEEVLEAVKVALELGAAINAVDDNGETAMHGAAYKNLPAVVEFLVEQGADVEVWNQKNKHGWSPLTIARGYRFGNFKPSLVTIAALEKVMLAAGVAIEADGKATSREIY